MEKENKLPQRKNLRLKNFDYSTAKAYFLTVCTKSRKRNLSKITEKQTPLGISYTVNLLSYGKIAKKYIEQMNDFYVNVAVDIFVIMPDHIHIMLLVSENKDKFKNEEGTRQTSTVPHFISTFKRFCNKEYGNNIWQRGYFDHIIRNRDDYYETIKYIKDNPKNWREDDPLEKYSID